MTLQYPIPANVFYSVCPGADLGFREEGVGVEIGARAKRSPEDFG